MSQEVILCCGVSGSGKTTWSSGHISKNPNFIRVNRDDLRKHFYGTLTGYYQHKSLNEREKYVTNIEELLFIGCLNEGYSVIIDNTNLKPSYIERWIQYVKAYNENKGTDIKVKFKLFPEYDVRKLKVRVYLREGKPPIKLLDYIDKQVSSLRGAIAYVEDNYKTQIINE